MTAVALPRPAADTWKTWTLPATAAAVFVAFFICEHNLRISLATAYTQSLEEMGATAEGGNLLRRLTFFLLGVMGLGLTTLAIRRPLRCNAILLVAAAAVPLWCFASILWAQDFGLCLRRLIVFACCCAGAIGVGRHFSLREICWLLFATTLATSFVGVSAEIVLGTFRPWLGDYRYSGTLHPNSTGIYLSGLILSAFTLARLSPQHRWKYVAALVWAIGLLLLTKSRTATAGLFVGLACLGVMQLSLQRQIILGASIAWIAGVVTLFVLVTGVDPAREMKSALFMGREEQTESFTGRDLIWRQVNYFIDQRPLAGYGFESFWTPEKIAVVSDEVQWAVREAHSSYLEVKLGLGVVGLGLIMAFIAVAMTTCLVNYFRCGDASYAWLFALFVFGLIDGTMESGLVTPQLVGFFICSAVIAMATAKPVPQVQGAAA